MKRTSSMKEGTITLLFKKRDARDIRDYRPNTLLNNAYNILAGVLAEKLKRMMHKFVGPQQTGCVLGRPITYNARLCQLMQAYLEEKSEKGLILFLGLEEYFDRASHEYLMEAPKAAGVGKRMRLWLLMIYNEDDPIDAQNKRWL